jgi:Rrf2 family protein
MTVLAELPDRSYAGAVDIAEDIQAPRNYLGKLLQSLAEARLVESQKGKGGGFRLARDPAKITIYDIVEPIDHVSRLQDCFMGGSKCSAAHACAVHSRWQTVRDPFLAFLKGTTLAVLARSSSPLPALT